MPARTIIITGGAQGIGLACIRRFLDEGYRVVMADRNDNAADAAVANFALPKSRLIAVHVDVADKLSVHNLVAETLSHFGQIDVLLNNAAIVKKGGVLDTAIEDFDQVLDVNLRGTFLLSQLTAKHMIARLQDQDDRSGVDDPNFSIINMSSINAKVSIGNYLAYTVSKGGLNQLTKAMALDLAPHGIRVNAIGPGSVRTDMLSKVLNDAKALDRIHSRTPLGRMAEPEEIAGVAAFLAGPDASYVTGECIYVDGGRLALNYTMPPVSDV